jgi:hypothetical protein
MAASRRASTRIVMLLCGVESSCLSDGSANVACRGDLDTSQRADTCRSCNAPMPDEAILGYEQHAIWWIGSVVIRKIRESCFDL